MSFNIELFEKELISKLDCIKLDNNIQSIFIQNPRTLLYIFNNILAPFLCKYENIISKDIEITIEITPSKNIKLEFIIKNITYSNLLKYNKIIDNYYNIIIKYFKNIFCINVNINEVSIDCILFIFDILY